MADQENKTHPAVFVVDIDVSFVRLVMLGLKIFFAVIVVAILTCPIWGFGLALWSAHLEQQQMLERVHDELR